MDSVLHFRHFSLASFVYGIMAENWTAGTMLHNPKAVVVLFYCRNNGSWGTQYNTAHFKWITQFTNIWSLSVWLGLSRANEVNICNGTAVAAVACSTALLVKLTNSHWTHWTGLLCYIHSVNGANKIWTFVCVCVYQQTLHYGWIYKYVFKMYALFLSAPQQHINEYIHI